MKYGFEPSGGFVVCSKAGNWSYAYPTSPNAYRAKQNDRDALHVARMMATGANHEAGWCPAAIVEAHNVHLSSSYGGCIAHVALEG